MMGMREMSQDWGGTTEKQQEMGQPGRLTGARGGLARAENCLDSDDAQHCLNCRAGGGCWGESPTTGLEMVNKPKNNWK